MIDWNRLKAHAYYYPTLWWNMLLGRILKTRNWWDRIDENVFLGAVPLENDVAQMASLGIRAVVNTCEETTGSIEQYQRHGIVQLRIPTVDYTNPRLSDIEQAVEFINEQIALGRKVYIHCKAGRTRSGMVAICWLIQNRQVPAVAAQTMLNNARPHVNKGLSARPVVKQFEAKHLDPQAVTS